MRGRTREESVPWESDSGKVGGEKMYGQLLSVWRDSESARVRSVQTGRYDGNECGEEVVYG